MAAQIVVGLYESKGDAQDVRNRLHTEGVSDSDLSIAVLHDIAPLPEDARQEELAALSVSPLILGDIEKTFAHYVRNGETAVIVQAATTADAQFAIEIMRLFDPLAIEAMTPRPVAVF